MHRRILYLTHPQVLVDTAKEIRDWSLSNLGQRRVITLANSNALDQATAVISSTETKAIETVRPLADALNCELEVRELMHENDRSSTGFCLPKSLKSLLTSYLPLPTPVSEVGKLQRQPSLEL